MYIICHYCHYHCHYYYRYYRLFFSLFLALSLFLSLSLSLNLSPLLSLCLSLSLPLYTLTLPHDFLFSSYLLSWLHIPSLLLFYSIFFLHFSVFCQDILERNLSSLHKNEEFYYFNQMFLSLHLIIKAKNIYPKTKFLT